MRWKTARRRSRAPYYEQAPNEVLAALAASRVPAFERNAAKLPAHTVAMASAASPGWVVVLNGAPRSGKSSIVKVIQETFEGPWMNLGVDVFGEHVIPRRYWPGMGLRPGGERPDIEAVIPAFYRAFYDSVAAHSRQGLNVVADVGHHDGYSTPMKLLPDAARRLSGLPALFVGVRCPVNVIMARRAAGQPGREGQYVTSGPGGEVPEPVLRWHQHVHEPGVYDLEIDTSTVTPQAAALMIRNRMDGPPPQAFRSLAASG